MNSASTRSWTDEDILRALGEWGWAPDGSEVIETADYRVVFRPASFDGVTSVERAFSTRPAAEIAGEVHSLARVRGIGEVIWNLYPTTTPADLADHLLALGGTIRDEGGLMSLRVPDDGRLDVGPTEGVVVHPVADVHGLTDYRRIVSRVYEQPLATAEEIAAEAEQITANDAAGSRFVAYVDDQPAGSGAIAVRDDGSASLFGAATYPELRGRGAYRAILAARTRWAQQHGVPVLLVSGRLATSAPIMGRVGFTLHGYTRSIAVPTTR
jgi:GNAT superfamily N-acetyltransferase